MDYVLSWGPLILGHRDPQVISHLHEAIDRAVLVHQHYLKINWRSSLLTEYLQIKVRMVSSGTEATLDTLRLARGYTGRIKL
ncbi:hypothetical protein ACVNP1_09150 [Staphylococcus aureus]